MRILSSFLDKFKNLKDPKEDREKIAAIISKELGFDLTADMVVLKKDIILIQADSYIKTELFIKKEHLLETLRKEGFKNIKEVR
ncbi:MAG TPA: hypothetical protein VJH63_03580 [Candidatus Paceibacterota bacterium]